MASKGRMGIQAAAAQRGESHVDISFNGQQRPDGDSGSWESRYHLQCRVSMASKGRMGIQGAPGGSAPPGGGVSMASKGRMGIQAGDEEATTADREFQWPAKAGWGFRDVYFRMAPFPAMFQWPAKAGWGFRTTLYLRVSRRRLCSFNGQQRPDGDSGQ